MRFAVAILIMACIAASDVVAQSICDDPASAREILRGLQIESSQAKQEATALRTKLLDCKEGTSRDSAFGQEDLEAAEARIELLEAEIADLRQSLGNGEPSSEVAALKVAQERIEALEKKLAVAEELAASASASRDTIAESLTSSEQALADARRKLTTSTEALKMAQSRASNLGAQLEAAKARGASELAAAVAERDTLAERLGTAERELELAQREVAAANIRATLAETEALKCAEKAASCSSSPDCEDKVTVTWDAPGIARMIVQNPCRGDDTLRVSSSNIRDPLLRALSSRFDKKGRAELTFPVVATSINLRVAGAERGAFSEITIEPPVQHEGGYVIMSWENTESDLDLLLARNFSTALQEPEVGFDLDKNAGIGTRILAQDARTSQKPRFEVIEIDEEWAGPLDIGVRHALRGSMATTPFCGNAAAASPGYRLYFLTPGEQLQSMTGEVASVACNEVVPAASQYTFLRRANF